MQKKLLLYGGLPIAILFIIVNIYFTQNIASTFFGIVYTNHETDAVIFLKKINRRTSFPDQINYFKTIYDEGIEKKVFFDTLSRRDKIQAYEKLLTKNPQSRDVLLVISRLYLDEGNVKKATDYYKQAKRIDPDSYIEKLD